MSETDARLGVGSIIDLVLARLMLVLGGGGRYGASRLGRYPELAVMLMLVTVGAAGCSWVNPSGRLGSDLPEVLKALAADKNTVHLNITAPTFGTLQFDKSAACPPTADPFGPGTPPAMRSR